MPTIETLCNWARQSAKAGSYERAVGLCRHVLQHFPKSIEAHGALAEVFAEMGDIGEAERYFKLVLSADPENVAALVGLGNSYKEQGNQEGALYEFERVLEIQPQNVSLQGEIARLRSRVAGSPKGRIKPSRGMLGRTYLRSGLYARAAKELKAVLDEDPSRFDMAIGLAEALWRDERFGDAAQACKSVLSAAPDCAKAKLLLAEMYLAGAISGDPHAMRAEARALDPDGHMAAVLFAGMPSASRWAVSPAEVPLPAEREFVAAAGELAEQAATGATFPDGKAPKVAKDARIDELETGLRLGHEEADWGQDVARLRSLLVANPGDHGSRLSLAVALARLGQIPESLSEFDYLLLAAPEVVRQISSGLKELLEEGIIHPKLHRLLADAYMKDGVFGEAIEHYAQALELESKEGEKWSEP